jgi:hypothetical protein
MVQSKVLVFVMYRFVYIMVASAKYCMHLDV